MVSVGKIITMLGQAKGSKAVVTLGKGQIMALAKEAGANERVLKEIGELLGQASKPNAQVAYKVRENGSAILGARFRDGRRILGSGALSVKDFGTETPSFISRLDIGEGGKYVQGRVWADLGQDIDLSKHRYGLNMVDGTVDFKLRYGDTASASLKFDGQKTLDDIVALTSKAFPDDAVEVQKLTYKNGMAKISKKLNEGLDELRKLLSGRQDTKPVEKIVPEEIFQDVKYKDIDVEKFTKRIKEMFTKKKDIKLS